MSPINELVGCGPWISWFASEKHASSCATVISENWVTVGETGPSRVSKAPDVKASNAENKRHN